MKVSGWVTCTLYIVALRNPWSLPLSICSECKATCICLILLHQSAWFMFWAHGKQTSFLEEQYEFSCRQDSLAALETCKSSVLLTQKCWVITEWENNSCILFSLTLFCLHAFTDCQPTLTPLRGSKDYVNDGSSFYNFTWNYNTDGRTIQEVQLKYGGTGNIDITVAGRTPTGQLQINAASGYSASRISFFGSLSGSVGKITFRISNIVQSDSRIFKCDLRFTTFNPPSVQSSVELVVVGK